MRLVLGEGFVIAAAGVAIGLAGSAMLTRLMASWLVGVTPRDPVTFAGGGLLLMGVALLAGYVPAWRASRVDRSSRFAPNSARDPSAIGVRPHALIA